MVLNKKLTKPLNISSHLNRKGVIASKNSMPLFFVVGTGRCGTSLFRNLLTRHPDVYIPQETHWIPILYNFFGFRQVSASAIFRVMEEIYMAKGLTALQRIIRQNKLETEEFKKTFLESLSHSQTWNLADFMSRFYQVLAERNGAYICGDKTPDYGCCMTLLQTLWPHVKFIHIFRDGRDVALSMSQVLSFRYQVAWEINHWYGIAYRKQYEREKATAESPLPIERFYELWKSRILRVWDESKRLKRESYMEIKYEDLLKNTSATLGKVSKFLRLPQSDHWIQEASRMVIPGNLKKNVEKSDYISLTNQYVEDLKSLGFDV